MSTTIDLPHFGDRPPGGRIPFIGAFESTFLPGHGVDVAELSGHDQLWRADLESVLAAGVRTVRYPLRWHRIEQREGHFDWSTADEVLEYLRSRGVEPVVDLVHHTSYPRWLSDGFRDRRFGPAFVRYAQAVADRYPWLVSYTLFNEPFATLFLAGHQALWPPYDSGMAGFVRLVCNVLPAVAEASVYWAEKLPQARHLWVDTCEHHAGTPGGPAAYAALANDRRHLLLDLALGVDLDPDRPFLREFLAAGGSPLLELPPVRVDMLGLDYYCHSEWWYDEAGSHSPSPHPVGLAALAEQYGARYGLPMVLSETNLRGTAADRASWLRYTLEQCEIAVARGVPLQGYCWFPHLDSCDWDSLLARPAGRVDPVGVIGLGARGDRQRTLFTSAWEAAAAGARSADLPAYRFQSPCDAQLAGLAAQTRHWDWQDPPPTDRIPPLFVPTEPAAPSAPEETVMTRALDASTQPDLVVLSHLRWTWVWQRPQHLVSRFAAERARAGARTWFVEEPVAGDVTEPVLEHEDRDGVTRVWLTVPRGSAQDDPGFDDPRAADYGTALGALLTEQGRPGDVDALLYTPMALDIAHSLSPRRVFYDVMDDLASFLDAPVGLKLSQRQLLAEADVVFTGGRSLHRGIGRQRTRDCFLFPSGVDATHYEQSRQLRQIRARHEPKVAGYVGVIDERLDLDLIAGLARELPEWILRIVGPVTKIDPGALPQVPNVQYPGMAPYAELPRIMAGFDVALMPFALNEATRSISPTKTLEYLAAGLPVVSTRVVDVVADYTGLVHFADDAAGFGTACRTVAGHSRDDRDHRLRPVQGRHDWDVIATAMVSLMDGDIQQAEGLGEVTA